MELRAGRDAVAGAASSRRRAVRPAVSTAEGNALSVVNSDNFGDAENPCRADSLPDDAPTEAPFSYTPSASREILTQDNPSQASIRETGASTVDATRTCHNGAPTTVAAAAAGTTSAPLDSDDDEKVQQLAAIAVVVAAISADAASADPPPRKRKKPATEEEDVDDRWRHRNAISVSDNHSATRVKGVVARLQQRWRLQRDYSLARRLRALDSSVLVDLPSGSVVV